MAVKIVRLPSDQFRARGYRTTPTPFFLLKSKKNAGDRARIGVVVGAAVHKSAAKRNFWKRQARAALTPLVAGGHDILIMVSPGATRLTRRRFREEVVKALTRPQQK